MLLKRLHCMAHAFIRQVAILIRPLVLTTAILLLAACSGVEPMPTAPTATAADKLEGPLPSPGDRTHTDPIPALQPR